MIFVRAASLFIIVALFVSAAFASVLSVKVTVSQDTLAVGTNVTPVTQGVQLEMKKAGLDGVAAFNVTDGSYFVQLRRYPYPLHVVLVEVRGDTNITLTMRPTISYASVYGQLSGPPGLSASSVELYSNGVPVKKISPNKDGYYLISYLSEGNYKVVFSAPGFDSKEQEAFLPASDFVEMNAMLQKHSPPPAPVVTLVAPQQVQQKSMIEATLSNGSQAFSGQALAVETPSGTISLTTDSEGKAKVNAAENGTYKFKFGNLTASTVVLGSQKAPVETPQQPSPGITYAREGEICGTIAGIMCADGLACSYPQHPGTIIADEAGTCQKQGTGSGSLVAMGAVALACLAVIAFAAGLFAAIKFFQKKHKHKGHEGHQHEHHKHRKAE